MKGNISNACPLFPIFRVKFDMILYDNHNRPISYVRLAVTDRCNLRCFYCMPEEGIKYLPKKEVMSFEEIERLMEILAGLGIRKVRLTGGEPFVRNDLMKLVERITSIEGIEEIHITTNGILTAPHVPALKKLGVKSVNLSLDTLDRQRFIEITRRDELDVTLKALDLLLEHEIPVKINTVVMDGKNTDDILPLVELSRHENIAVRFIEEMPFNGTEDSHEQFRWSYKRIIEHIQKNVSGFRKLTDPAFSTSYNYKVDGYKGTVGVIAAFSRTFCGTCNRIRVTAQGELKTCLYGDGVLNLKSLMRSGKSDEEIKQLLLHAFSNRAKDGFEAEQSNAKPIHESMSTIGG
jgi:molybdenum cofactor biosynthesis protein A